MKYLHPEIGSVEAYFLDLFGKYQPLNQQTTGDHSEATLQDFPSEPGTYLLGAIIAHLPTREAVPLRGRTKGTRPHQCLQREKCNEMLVVMPTSPKMSTVLMVDAYIPGSSDVLCPSHEIAAQSAPEGQQPARWLLMIGHGYPLFRVKRNDFDLPYQFTRG